MNSNDSCTLCGHFLAMNNNINAKRVLLCRQLTTIVAKQGGAADARITLYANCSFVYLTLKSCQIMRVEYISIAWGLLVALMIITCNYYIQVTLCCANHMQAYHSLFLCRSASFQSVSISTIYSTWPSIGRATDSAFEDLSLNSYCQ